MLLLTLIFITVSFKDSSWCAELRASNLISVNTRSFSLSCFLNCSTISGLESCSARSQSYKLLQIEMFINMSIYLFLFFVNNQKQMTYVVDEWLFFNPNPLTCGVVLSIGDDGADISERKAFWWFRAICASSASESELLRFFLDREKALLNELRN